MTSIENSASNGRNRHVKGDLHRSVAIAIAWVTIVAVPVTYLLVRYTIDAYQKLDPASSQTYGTPPDFGSLMGQWAPNYTVTSMVLVCNYLAALLVAMFIVSAIKLIVAVAKPSTSSDRDERLLWLVATGVGFLAASFALGVVYCNLTGL